MASSVGPLSALLVDMPLDWVRSAALDSQEVLLRSQSSGQAWIATAVSKNLASLLQNSNEPIWVFLAQVIREDGEDLYAFSSLAERALFLELKTIDSIGSKTAAIAVSELGHGGLSLILQSASLPSMKVPGLGPKTLEKIRIGMKAKPENFARILRELSTSKGTSSAEQAGGERPAETVAVSGKKTKTPFVFTPHIPDLVLQALSQLGLKADEILKLFEESQAQMSADGGGDLAKKPVGEQIKILLALWGRYKKQPRDTVVG